MAKVAAEVGTTANRYQILAKLASGGMAEIFLARGASVAGVERYCVLKRILRERASDAEFVQMFVHEARLVAQLQHPNIASVYDIGMLGDSYFFTMEYVHGETIRSLLLRAQALHRPLPLASVLTIIAGAAAGLHHAHERNSNDGRPLGIVHRDVSPSNLMVSYEGNVKVVDFGVAKAEDCRVETRSGTVKGKISYLSPEQCRGARVDRRSDVFSLGIVLWEMLTGERLYRRDSDFDNMTAIVHEATPPPSTCRSDLPPAIDDLVARMLAKSPSDRIQTAAEVVDAIEAASMDAGTILSTSAVSRLVRELFGVRAEPWLELDGDAASPEPSTIESRPLPPDLGRGPSDAVGARIAGALDPILSRLVAERRAISMPSALVVRPQSERVTEVAAPGELPPSTSSAVPADLTSGAEPEAASAASAASGTGTCTTVFAPPGGLLAQSAPPEDPIAASAASPVVNGALASTANATGSPLALGQDRAVITSSSAATAPGGSVAPASRVARRLVAVTVVASALGVIPILRAMPPAPDPPPAGNTSSAAAPPPDAAARTLDANGVPATSPPRELTPSDAAHAVDPMYDAATPPVRDAPAAPRAAPLDASIHEPGPHIAAPPPHRPAAIDAGAARQVPPDAALIDPVQPAPVPPETVAPPALELVSRLFRNGDHAMVVRICSAAPLSRDIADICVMAACQQRDAALAARWLPFDDPARRDQLVAFCKEHGAADIGNTLDCAANPFDCR